MKKRKNILFFLILILYQNTFSQVSQQWVSMFNGPADRFDFANAIAIDNSGNVYVTGPSEVSQGTGTNYDYITIKYNSAGIQQWMARYNGPVRENDKPVSIATDGSGNVYVTGFSQGTGIGEDYVTIKYNTFGNEVWVQRYTGPVDSADQATALAIDNSGNIYVTGYSKGSLTGNDIATIKYNSNGDSLWVQRFNQSGNHNDAGASVTVDASGNVYVTGYSGGFTTSADFVTLKYNSSGVLVWVQSYNGTNGASDFAVSIAVDGSGNVYVTGNSSGNGSDDDYATIKYDPSGVRQWVKRYDGLEHGIDIPKSFVVDLSGNVYVTGMSIAFGAGYDYATIKYNTSGVQQWVKRYNGPGENEDIAYSMAVDGSHNVYVSGRSLDSSFHRDCTTIKYDPNGGVNWIERYGANSNNAGHAIKVDNSGNVYVTGSTDANNIRTDFLTIKYSQFVVGINSISNEIPLKFMLLQNYPNPFNPITKINYSIPNFQHTILKVYDVLGNEVAMLVNEKQNAGTYEVDFDGSSLSSGVYLYKLSTHGFSNTKRMILLK